MLNPLGLMFTLAGRLLDAIVPRRRLQLGPPPSR